jgi:hypothetical protein
MKPGEPGENRDLEQAFAALRHEEAEAGPSFAALWAATEERRRTRTARPLRPFLLASAAAAGLLAVVLALWRVPAPSAVPALSQWRPATDFLLQTPGRDLLGEVPPLGRGLFDAGPSTPSTDHSRR